MNFNTFAARSIARFGSAKALAAENPLLYWRLQYALARKTWPQHTKLECTEYGWLLKCRNRNPYPLARLRMVEAAIRCDVACREAAQAWRNVA